MKDSAHHLAGAPASGMTVGARVWLLRDGGFGRVVALGQGGLICRVLLESGSVLVERPGCELMAVTPAPTS